MQQIAQSDDAAHFLFLKAIPIAKMFFRPEEIHRTSGIRDVDHPFSNRDGNMADQPSWIFRFDLAVLHRNPDGLSAIKAHRVYLYGLSRKQPADR